MHIVTGGAGFIGSNTLKYLEDKGHKDTVVCDVLGTEEKWRNISKRELGTIILPQELFTFLNQNASRIDTIFHMGAISTTTEKDADAIIANNLRLSQSLWSWCGTHKKRLIYASSAATYGRGEGGFNDYESPDSLKKLNPMNAYGWSKHLFDRWVSRISQSNVEKPKQCVGLKFFNVYGPNEYHKGGQKSVVCHAFDAIKKGDPVKLFKSNTKEYADGGQLRDFIYVKDCVQAMMWFYENPQLQGLYNVGTGKARSFEDLVNAVYASLGEKPKIQYIEMPDALKKTYQNFTKSNQSKLSDAGFTPYYSLEQGVKEYVHSFLDLDDPYL
ncbi:ADP-glyceromanno-heptose 6-epimerase [Alphaproteobacteria bacterium]|nr:ADP-glyceromanno-heptose 6-epimerase [Alphaproteobacteria bacterium]